MIHFYAVKFGRASRKRLDELHGAADAVGENHKIVIFHLCGGFGSGDEFGTVLERHVSLHG